MGCWNATCGVTQLPIVWEEPVRAFFVYVRGWEDHDPDRRTQDFSGTVGSTQLAAPYPIPLKGVYDDYGRIEKIESGLGITTNCAHFGLEPDELEDFLGRVERGTVVRKDPIYAHVYGEVGVGLFFVHGFLYDSVKETPHYERLFSDARYYFQALDDVDWSRYNKESYKRREDLFASLDEDTALILNEIYKDGNEGLSLTPKGRSKVPFPALPEVESDHRYNLFDKILMSGRHHSIGMGSLGATHEVEVAVRDLYLQGKRFGTDQEVQELAEELALAFAFRQFMYRARKQWIPGSCKGSQDDMLAPHLHIAKHMIRHMKENVEVHRWTDWESNDNGAGWDDLLAEFDIKREEPE